VSQPHASRVKTVLVVQDGSEDIAIVTDLIVSVTSGGASSRLEFTGPAQFNSQTIEHIRDTVLTIADRLVSNLGLDESTYAISVANLGIASVSDLGIQVAGFSADCAILLGMISASLDIRIPDDLVVTAHLASKDGHIGPVRSLRSKLLAAAEHKSIHRFIYGSLDGDGSLNKLAPTEIKDAITGLTSVRDRLRTTPITTITELIGIAFNDEEVVRASLTGGFWGMPPPPDDSASHLQQCTSFFLKHLEDRHWVVLEELLRDGRTERAETLVRARVAHATRTRTYPPQFGQRLIALLSSLPPGLRRLNITKPLLSAEDARLLSSIANPSEFDDLPHLFEATSTQSFSTTPNLGRSSTHQRDKRTDCEVLDAILRETDTVLVAERIHVPIDNARGSYRLDKSVVSNYDEFLAVVTSYYNHVMRRLGIICGSTNSSDVTSEAIDKVSEAYRGDGGFSAAVNQGIVGTDGGMLTVLDRITDFFKRDTEQKYINGVFKRAIDSRVLAERVNIVKAILARLASILPEEYGEEDPTAYADNHEKLLGLLLELRKTMQIRVRSLL